MMSVLRVRDILGIKNTQNRSWRIYSWKLAAQDDKDSKADNGKDRDGQESHAQRNTRGGV